MLDLDATIEPGAGLGGIAIGAATEGILAAAEPERVVELPAGGDEEPAVTIHSFGAIRTWSVEGRVEQVGAFDGYRGRTSEGIGLGSTVAEIRAAYGEVAPMGGENVLQLSALPGVGIETTPWSSPEHPDPTARIVQVFVHAVDDEA